MHLDPAVTAAGLLVGFVVGMTGMGGGAIMTPVLVVVFGIPVPAAVASDLVAAMVMKPIGGLVHARRGTVNADLVRWLMAGSVPAAFAGVFVVRALGAGPSAGARLQWMLGAVLLVASLSIVAKGHLQARGARRAPGAGPAAVTDSRGPAVNRPLTLLIGAFGGLVVGMTSVGSGSLIIVALMLLYPSLSASELVGTDIVQAIPLVAAAALGHILFGDLALGLTASLVVGAVPGVYLGARLSSRAPDGLIRPALVFVLFASALKLLGLASSVIGLTLLAVVVAGPPLWALVDALGWSREHFERSGQSKRRWVTLHGVGTVLPIVGSGAAIAYFRRARPRLMLAAAPERGDEAA